MNPSLLSVPKPRTGKPEIVMAPLVDIVFLLLIFFMVTTVFPEHSGMQIEKPKSDQTAILDDRQITISVDERGTVFYRNKRVTIDELRVMLKEDILLQPDKMVLIKADRRARVETLVDVMDAGKGSGARKMGIATDERQADR